MTAMSVFKSLLVIASGFLVTTSALASHETPLYRATTEYREVVLDFEREVFRSHHFDRFAERLADDLEDASGRLKSASRRCDQLDRLLGAWEEVRCLEPRVEAAIFGGPRCHAQEVLAVLWNRVRYASREVELQIALLQRPVFEYPQSPRQRYGEVYVPTPVPTPIHPQQTRTQQWDRRFNDPRFQTPHVERQNNARPTSSRQVQLHDATSQRSVIERSSDSPSDLQRRVMGAIEIGARLSRRFD